MATTSCECTGVSPRALKRKEVDKEQVPLERVGILGNMGMEQSQASPGILDSLQNPEEVEPRIPWTCSTTTEGWAS